MQLWIFSTLFIAAQSAKILVFNPKFGYSHMKYTGQIADSLHLAGYDVTVLQPVVIPRMKGTGCLYANVTTIEADQATLDATTQYTSDGFWAPIWTSSLVNPFPVISHVPLLAKMYNAALKNMLNQTALMNELREKQFDLAITELFDFSGVVLFHELGIKNIIGVSSFVTMEGTSLAVGEPVLPSFIPGSQSVASDDSSIWNRILSLAFSYCSYKFQNDLAIAAQELWDEIRPDAPRIWEIVANMSYIFTNSDPLLDFPKPTLHKIIDIGGLGLKPPQPLDEHFEKILSLRKKTALISFGSIAHSNQMPIETKNAIIKAIKKFPEVTFLWKYETPEDGFGRGVENLILSSWTPQHDLLADNRIAMFMTHGGAHSTYEGITSGVPLIIVPLFGDQMRNAHIAERHGFGKLLRKTELADENAVEDAFRHGLYDKEMRATAKRVQYMLQNRPISPEELLLRHVEFALKMENLQFLNPKGRLLSTIVYYNIDIFVLFIAIVASTLYFIYLMLKGLFRSSKHKAD